MDRINRGLNLIWPIACSSFVAVGSLIALPLLVASHDWLREGSSGSEAMRNLAVAIMTTIALILAVIRNFAAHKQLLASERSRHEIRLMRASIDLGSQYLFVRLGAIYTMERLVDTTEQCCLAVHDALSAFVTHAQNDATDQADLAAATDLLKATAPKVEDLRDAQSIHGVASRAMVLAEALTAVAVALIVFLFTIAFLWFGDWGWLTSVTSTGPNPEREPVVSTSSNLLFVVVATLALPMGIWAGLIAYRQSESVHQRVRDELYDTAISMLAKGPLSIRMNGIRRVRDLVREDTRYYSDAKRLLCSFLRHPPNPGGCPPPSPDSTIRPDLQSAAAFVLGWAVERFELGPARRDGVFLHGTNLAGLHLANCYALSADLSNAKLEDVELAGAFLLSANLEHTDLRRADLTRAMLSHSRFSGADLTAACLQGADLSSASMQDVKGLTQAQLDSAAHASTPPNLDRSLDRETSRQLTWRLDIERPTHSLSSPG